VTAFGVRELELIERLADLARDPEGLYWMGGDDRLTLDRIRAKIPELIREALLADGARPEHQISIESLNISTRAYNCLKDAKVRSAGDLLELTAADLLRCKNLGRGSLAEIQAELARFGLNLKADRRAA
jgi:DNA-directed RNA polymerase alpha subunit